MALWWSMVLKGSRPQGRVVHALRLCIIHVDPTKRNGLYDYPVQTVFILRYFISQPTPCLSANGLAGRKVIC